MNYKNKDKKCFRQLGKYILNGYFFLKVLARAVFRAQPEVYGGALLQK